MLKNPVLSSIAATILFAGTLGVLIAVAGFGFLRIGEQSLEALGYLPLRWGANNIGTLMELAIALSLPLVIWFVMWFYRRALAKERTLTGYKYNPTTR